MLWRQHTPNQDALQTPQTKHGVPSYAPQPAGNRSWQQEYGSACNCTKLDAVIVNPDQPPKHLSFVESNRWPVPFSTVCAMLSTEGFLHTVKAIC